MREFINHLYFNEFLYTNLSFILCKISINNSLYKKWKSLFDIIKSKVQTYTVNFTSPVCTLSPYVEGHRWHILGLDKNYKFIGSTEYIWPKYGI